MSGFVDVSNMTSEDVRRMGHADDYDEPQTFNRNPYSYRKPMNKAPKANISHNADDVWAAAVAAQRINGAYVKLSMISESDPEMTQKSNRQIVESLIADPRMITAQDFEQGKKVRSFFQAFTFKILQGKQLSEFDNTAMLIANRDTIDTKYDIAVLTSLPAGYERGIKRQTVDQRIAFATGSLIGRVSEKVSSTIEVLKSFYSNQWNTNYITGITSDDQVVFFAYKLQLEVGKQFDIYGTVKAHRDNSTQLNRVKVI